MRCITSLYRFTMAIAVVLLTISGAAKSANPVIRLGPIVNVLGANTGSPNSYAPAWASADPANARYLIICGNMRDPADNLGAIGYLAVSIDGGATWKRTLFDNSSPWVSEEACAYGSGHAAYFIDSARQYQNGQPVPLPAGYIHFYASRDGGITWVRTWASNGWFDWNSIASFPVSGSHSNTIVVFANHATDRHGRWLPQADAMQSGDGGHSFVPSVAHPRGFQYDAAFTGENVVLPDGTVLFATSTDRGLNNHSKRIDETWVEIFSYDPVHHQLVSRAVLRTRHHSPIFTAAIAEDRSRGHFNGRLYAAWVEEDLHASALWLATSDDQAHHWTSRPILRGRGVDYLATCMTDPPIDQVALATTPDGTLGMTWIENRSMVRFAASRDGGATFEEPATVAHVDTSGLALLIPISYNDYRMKTVLDKQAAKPNFSSAWVLTLGLGVVAEPNIVSDLSLVADRNNHFHAFWSEAHGLMTRTIAVEGGFRPGESRLSSPAITTCARESANTLAHPVIPHPLPKIMLADHYEITNSIGVNLLGYAYDPAKHTITVDATIVNTGKTTLYGPITILGVNPHSDFGKAYVLNAAGSMAGQPYWKASPLALSTGIAPGAQSKPLHVAVAISGFRRSPSNYLSGNAFSMAIRAYGEAVNKF